MTPAPLSKVIRIITTETGNPDRARAVYLINAILELLYRTPELTFLYFKAEGCVLARRFTENCRNLGTTGFLGVVMPPQVQNVRELNTDGTPFRITEGRVDPSCGGGRHCDPLAEHLPPRLLEHDIPVCLDSRVVTFRSDSPHDIGLLVGVRYVDLNNKEQREDVVLGPGRVATSLSVGEFLEITFPERQGWITVETDNGAPLGRYHPSILIPTHEWFRLQAGNEGMKVQYRGLREPLPLVFDTDPVPFSDVPLWKLALKAYEFVDATELTPGQTSSLNRIYASLASVAVADSAAKTLNFNAVLFPESANALLGAARAFSRRGGSRRNFIR